LCSALNLRVLNVEHQTLLICFWISLFCYSVTWTTNFECSLWKQSLLYRRRNNRCIFSIFVCWK
jgi:hypothetical protein